MDELLKAAPEEEEDKEDTDIYYGTDRDNLSGYDFGESGERERDEDDYEEDEWEYQTEYDEWENEMDYVNSSRCSDVQEMIDTLTEVHDDFINDSDHRYWPDDRERIENIITEMKELCDRLYSRAEDYRSNPEDW
jgi:hypothetical protein